MKLHYIKSFGCSLWLMTMAVFAVAQQKQQADRCGTMQVLEIALKKDPTLKTRMEAAEQQLQQVTTQRAGQNFREEAVTYYIPVVFHIVLTNPNVVTDAQIKAQLDTLNHDYAGLNGDSTRIPAAFKPLYAKSNIRFVLAQRTPDDGPTTGIERYVATKSSYGVNDNSLKYTSAGGASVWDPNKYMNVWVTNLSGGILGYGTFPNTTVSAEQGIAIAYTSLPGASSGPYNKGRTLTHEAGHFFNLYHIWGDDNGACSGTDYVDDTPNQASETYGCPSTTVVTDNCTTTAPGIMYQNFMDYTDDACMVMFTVNQGTRMESALNLYRSSLLTSNAATPVVLKSLDASLRTVLQPTSRICASSFSPSVTLRNSGSSTLTGVDIYASIDGGTAQLTHWTGSLASLASASVTLSNISTSEGTHTLKVYVANPNAGTDMDKSNDTLTTSFFYWAAVSLPISEGFESAVFPPTRWDIVNPDNSYTWERVTGVAKTGSASVVIRNLAYGQNDQKDYLRLPVTNITNADSAFITFQLAAAVQTNPATAGNVWDTLEVLVSKDCGVTYTSLYKKWGKTLITRSTAVTTSFVPTATEWRKDSVDLSSYIGAGDLMLAFLNTSEWENNIYLDDINVYKVSINPNLKAKGFLVTPSPTNGVFAVQFYPNPANLKGISVYNSTGQKVAETLISGTPVARYNFDISRYSSGVYIIQAVFGDKTLTQKIIKAN
ncbi:MAG: M43 family zinc metalloprotease [Chitinophagaceae bacterium]